METNAAFAVGFFHLLSWDNEDISALLNAYLERIHFCQLYFFLNGLGFLLVLIGICQNAIDDKQQQRHILIYLFHEVFSEQAIFLQNFFNIKTRQMSVAVDKLHYLIKSKVAVFF